jgi:hypothetical protein
MQRTKEIHTEAMGTEVRHPHVHPSSKVVKFYKGALAGGDW